MDRNVSVISTDITRGLLRELMPLDTIVTDLRDWGIHFEDSTFADTFFDIALGPEDFALTQAEDLKDDILHWIEEYDMDCAREQWTEEEFQQWVLAQCRDFIRKWRSNIGKQFLVDEGTAHSQIHGHQPGEV